jgi:ABC-2 type transport system ATP-binding protein
MTEATMMIEVQNLFKNFGSTTAVEGLSLQVAQGEIYGLVGPDGAGKTTTIRLVCGALTPTRLTGNAPVVIRIAGIELLRHIEQARAQIGYLPQRFSLYEDLTVLENLRFLAEVRGLPAANWKPRCMEILSFVGLDAFSARRAGQLSGGMKQKLGLAAALVHRPKILLLDEPTTGVDPVTRQDFWQLIIRLVAEEGVALLVSTPYMDEASRCSRLGFMQRGRLIVEGTPAELRERLNERIVEVRGSPLRVLMAAAQADADVEEAQMFGDRLHLRVRLGSAEAVSHRLAAQIPVLGGQVSRICPIPPQLEDVFIALVEPQI